eukprot:CAMPEP_0177651576 /NCGR_PEP_ID=MMETSP0447-20121125/12634_1 /TAXON_ID=0 /ORGANISM="Stygamoeba regulata, Strain BSH-02190019" /LENGTH=132 /DNA_ID=CAMNT_0019154691 /DNA_START=49 /DNA_END=447 /DNA_ORIENTATION=+
MSHGREPTEGEFQAALAQFPRARDAASYQAPVIFATSSSSAPSSSPSSAISSSSSSSSPSFSSSFSSSSSSSSSSSQAQLSKPNGGFWDDLRLSLRQHYSDVDADSVLLRFQVWYHQWLAGLDPQDVQHLNF